MKSVVPVAAFALTLILAGGLVFLAGAGGDKDRVIPNDPFFKFQVSFLNPGGRLTIERSSLKPSPVTRDAAPGIDPDLTRAWTISTGSASVVVALLDDGFAYWHADVRDNIWANPGETGLDATGHLKESNGIDDDGNGYVDDVMGWDFAFDDPDPDAYVFDGMRKDRIQPYWHSISAMGIIGARGDNGLGVAGINWRVSMMLLKIGAQGIGRNETDTERPLRAARAIRYAAANGARVINWSGFVSDPTPQGMEELRTAIDYAASKGVLLVVGAGNSGLDIDRQENFTYPACFPAENILTVAEIDFTGELVRYEAGSGVWRGSNFGPRNVDISAIGENFTTDITNNRSTYRLGAGTSCSAPVVTGVAALALSVRPGLSAVELKKLLMDAASPLPALKGKVGCGGMVNAYRALSAAK